MNRSLFQYDPVVGYRFVPGVRARVPHEAGGYLVRTNAAGFRSDHEFTPQKPEGTFRVLLFGDSYTAGDGVSGKHRYGELLEQAVPGLQVFNFGLPGTGTDQQYLAWREHAAGIEHDLLVVAVLAENIRRVAARSRIYQADGEERVFAKPYFTLEDGGELRLHNVPVPREPLRPEELEGEGLRHLDRGGGHATLRKLANRLGVKEVMQSLTRYQPLPMYDRPSSPEWRLMRAVLARWVSESAAPVLLVPLPIYQYVEETSPSHAYRARFRELAQEAGVELHDPLPDFHRVPKAERRALRFEQDVHPTAAWHRVLADSLAPRLRALAERSPGAASG
jgi:GDSL-like Lipase/Acylhydrolase family